MQHLSRAALALAVLTAAGCPTDGGDPAPPDSESWFEGTITATKPDGDPLGDPSVSLLKRSTLPALERIDEQIVELDDGGVALEVLAASTVVAEDGTFRTQYQDEFGVLEGFGAMTAGEDWAWTAWESQVEYTSGPLEGTTLQSTALLDGATLTIETDVIGADSVLEVIEVRELTVQTEADWESRYAELLGD